MVKCINCRRRWEPNQHHCPWCGHLTVAVQPRINFPFIASLKVGAALILISAAIFLIIAIAVALFADRWTRASAGQSTAANAEWAMSARSSGAVVTVTTHFAAQQQYKGLAVRGLGVITRTGVDFAGNLYLELDDGVQAVFTKVDAERLARLRRGETTGVRPASQSARWCNQESHRNPANCRSGASTASRSGGVRESSGSES